MSLEYLLKTGQLKRHETDAAEVQRLLQAAQRNLADSKAVNISPETQLDAAYKAITQAGLIALMASGFRPDTNKPGHQMTVVQSLADTVGLDAERVAVLDALRRKRNLSDYTGDDIDHASVDACIDEAQRLLKGVEVWLRKRRPDLT